MTFWHKLSTAAAHAPGIGSIVALMQRLGDHSEARAVAVPDPHPEHSITFTIAIIALSAKLARSDGAVTVDEVEAFRRIMDVPPGDEENVRRLFDLAKRDTAGFEVYAGQIGALLADDAGLRREVL